MPSLQHAPPLASRDAGVVPSATSDLASPHAFAEALASAGSLPKSPLSADVPIPADPPPPRGPDPAPPALAGGLQAELPAGPAPTAAPQPVAVPSAPLSAPRLALDDDPPHRDRAARADPLDPATRHAAQLAPFEVSQVHAPPAPAPVEAQARASLEALLPDLVRKIAWSGDGRKGSMRLELGAGSLAGGTLVVHAESGRVRVELDAPAGADAAVWHTRLSERLSMRGVAVDELIVR